MWVFYNVETRTQTKPMPLMQAQSFVLSLKSSDITHVVAWTPGWKKWVHIREVLRAYPDVFPIPPPLGGSHRENTHLIDITPSVSKSTRKTRTRKAVDASVCHFQPRAIFTPAITLE